MANGEEVFNVARAVGFTLEAICRQLIQAKVLDKEALIVAMQQLTQDQTGLGGLVPATLLGLLDDSHESGQS
jgi:hypothetical protein